MFQLTGPDKWSDTVTALGFHPRLKEAGFEHLGVIIDNDAKRTELLALLDDLFATGPREDWWRSCAARTSCRHDQHAARNLQRS